MNLGTIVTAMITPFDRRGMLDVAEAERLARWLVARETDGSCSPVRPVRARRSTAASAPRSGRR